MLEPEIAAAAAADDDDDVDWCLTSPPATVTQQLNKHEMPANPSYLQLLLTVMLTPGIDRASAMKMPAQQTSSSNSISISIRISNEDACTADHVQQ
jgi:hypothetical protein